MSRFRNMKLVNWLAICLVKRFIDSQIPQELQHCQLFGAGVLFNI